MTIDEKCDDPIIFKIGLEDFGAAYCPKCKQLKPLTSSYEYVGRAEPFCDTRGRIYNCLIYIKAKQEYINTEEKTHDKKI